MTIFKFEKQLAQMHPYSIFKKVHIDKSNEDYILRYRRDGVYATLSLYDVGIMSPISKIDYEIYNDNCYIAQFMTDYDYQGKGLGKYLYQLAQAHIDSHKVTYSHGIIQPIADIKGVSDGRVKNVASEKKFLMLMYHALGNTIIENPKQDKNTNPVLNLVTFEDRWQPHTKIAKLNKAQLKFLDSMMKYDKESKFRIELEA